MAERLIAFAKKLRCEKMRFSNRIHWPFTWVMWRAKKPQKLSRWRWRQAQPQQQPTTTEFLARGMPITMVTKPGFTALINTLDKRYSMPSQTYLVRLLYRSCVKNASKEWLQSWKQLSLSTITEIYNPYICWKIQKTRNLKNNRLLNCNGNIFWKNRI